LRRRTSLRAHAPLARRTALTARRRPQPAGTAAAGAKVLPPVQRARGGFQPPVVAAALQRAGHGCELCSRRLGPVRGIDWSAHHRRPRGAGGTSDPTAATAANCLIVCGHGTFGCHGLIESRRAAALRAGWLLRQGQDPAAVPALVRIAGQPCQVLLGVDGRYREVPA
jgi:hypothetical protein